MKLEALGVPGTVIVTGPFEDLAKRFCATLGVTGYDPVVVSHAVSRGTDEFVREVAEAAANQVWAAMLRVPV